MSLDVYLYETGMCPHCGGEVSGGNSVYSSNITHNLGAMAHEAGIYLACWRPGEMLDPEKSARMKEQSEAGNYHGPGGVYEIEKTLPVVHARDLIEPLRKGLADLKARPAHFERFNSPNGWGRYEHFVPWVERYLAACEDYPNAEVSVSR